MIQTIIAVLIIILAIYYIIRKKKPSCKDKSCSGCSLKDECNKK